MEISNIFLNVIIFLSLAVAYFCFYLRKKLSYWSKRGIEELPATHWFFGHFKEGILFQASPGWHLGQLYKRARKNAPFVGFYIFHKPCLLVKDPKIIRQILIKDFDIFPDRNFAGNTQKDSIGLRNLFAIRGPEWKYMRQKFAPIVTKSMQHMLRLMLQTGKPMLEYIDRQKEKQLDAQDLSFKYAADLIASVALGTNTDSFSNPDGEVPRILSSYFYSFRRMLALVSVFFMPDVVDRTGSLLFFNSKFMRKVFWTAMDEREKSGEKRGDFIDFAKHLQSEQQNPLYEFSGDNLVHQAGTFFSGFESSATTAGFTLMELARHKAFQDEARADIRQAIEKHGWTYDAFKEMRVLEQCIREAMRMHPQVSTLDRVGKEDYKIPGTNYTIEKGTAIYISIYGLHEDPMHFENPRTYDPGRFNKDRVVSDAYLPFGAGPRMCLGTKIGLLHTKAVVSMILAHYEIHQNPEEEHVLDSRSTFTAAADGLMIQFRKLDEN
ncbi:cytochrome P450 6k1-like [Cydia pomonella]|uniref:cytochrome P450 6k1-like n=1 Tax=Cydia pomonella TaxID=82600 RepID=UPI002ADDFE9B|nr:cytochrome P450 6k1-like [Cydia pomonella]